MAPGPSVGRGPAGPVHPDDFQEAYQDRPPWEIGRPQGAVVQALSGRRLEPPVLEPGCGTGEHTLLAASMGLEAWGIDLVPEAIRVAKDKALARGLLAEFRVHDALRLPGLGRTFGTVLDVGLFHVFDDADRARYVAGLEEVLEPSGALILLCFSDAEDPSWGGPRRVARKELEAAFAPPRWEVESIRPTRFETILEDVEGHAWLGVFRRRDSGRMPRSKP